MDDLVMEGKTYLSSKRAAEITGYAKDYIGQLCREGRVEARLVGRSWYVLEESIREHRFGKSEEKEEQVKITSEEAGVGVREDVASPWNSPKYISEEVASLPELRPRLAIPRSLNLLARTEASDISNVQAVKKNIEESRLSEEVPTSQIREEEISIPIHKVSEVEKASVVVERPHVPQPRLLQRQGNRVMQSQKSESTLLHMSILIAVAVISLTVILIGTGYVDSAPFKGGKGNVIDYLGGKSFYSK